MNRRAEDEAGFEEAWRAFAEDDARVQAPPDLEARVLAAVNTLPRFERANPHRQLIQVASLAATILLTTTALVWHLRRDAPSSEPTAAPVATAEKALTEAPVRSAPSAIVADNREPAPRVTPTRYASRREPLPPVLMTLGASPVRDTEALQLVRLRLPREALQALGVVLLEPDAAGLVDVDVLIGEDGLARDIRQVQTGGEHP